MMPVVAQQKDLCNHTCPAVTKANICCAPVLWWSLCREQSLEYGTKIYTETVNSVDLQHGTPFTLLTDTKVVQADALIIATGAAAKRLKIPGTDEETGFWNKGISACAVCDGSSPLFRCVQQAARLAAAVASSCVSVVIR